MGEDSNDEVPGWAQRALAKQREMNEERALAKTGAELTDKEKLQKLFSLALSQKSANTIRSYEQKLSLFARWMGIPKHRYKEAIPMLLSLGKVDAELRVLEYMAWMEDQGKAPKTVAAHLSAIKFFTKIAQYAGWVDWAIQTKNPPAENRKMVEAPSDKKFAKILEVFEQDDSWLGRRDRLVFYMISFMGLRIDEVLSLDVEHIDIVDKKAWINPKGLEVERIPVTIPDKTFELAVQVIGDRVSGPLFVGEKSPRLPYITAYRMVRKAGEAVGIKGMHPHAFRHFGATQAAEITDDNVRKMQAFTRHKNPDMLEVYVKRRHDHGGQVAQGIEEKWLQEDDEGEERNDG